MLRLLLNVKADGDDFICSGREFQRKGAENLQAWSPYERVLEDEMGGLC